MNKKPNNVITIVHTGFGDTGKTKVGGETISKTKPIVKFMGLIDECQSLTISEYLQNYLFILGALANNPNNDKYKIELDMLYDDLKSRIVKLISDLPPLTGFIRTTSDNQSLMQLRAKVRQAEIAYCEHYETLSETTSTINLCKYINLLSDYIFAHIWFCDSTFGELKVWEGIK